MGETKGGYREGREEEGESEGGAHENINLGAYEVASPP